ncbi:hypothetical protein RSAG8_05910, partial [Rhizoctonia solani AG-8 WAC10335]
MATDPWGRVVLMSREGRLTPEPANAARMSPNPTGPLRLGLPHCGDDPYNISTPIEVRNLCKVTWLTLAFVRWLNHHLIRSSLKAMKLTKRRAIHSSSRFSRTLGGLGSLDYLTMFIILLSTVIAPE